MWINVTTGAVCKLHSDIRKDKPDTSFPAVITDEVLAEAGYEPVTPTAADIDAATHEAILSAITALESTVTPRRIREAVTTTEGKTWMVAVDSQIAALRGSLVK